MNFAECKIFCMKTKKKNPKKKTWNENLRLHIMAKPIQVCGSSDLLSSLLAYSIVKFCAVIKKIMHLKRQCLLY